MAVACLAALVVAFNPDLVFGGLIPAGYDTNVYFYPLREYFAWSISQGRLPLWNPYLFAGSPYLANPQTAVFYPGTWLFAAMWVPSAYALNIVGHVVLGAVGIYAFSRAILAVDPIGGAAAGFAFAISGVVTGHYGHLNQISVIAWIPWAMLAAARSTRAWSAVAVSALTAILALQIMAGHPQQTFIGLVAVGIVILWRAIGDGWRALARGVGSLAIAGVLALGLCAVQLLPTYELAGLSIRSGGLSLRQATFDSLPWELLLPALFPGYWSNLASTELYGHTTTVFFAMGLLGLACGSWRSVALAATLVTAGLVLAVGQATPIYELAFSWVPGFGSFRAPARWLTVYTLGAALLCGVGVGRAVELSRDQIARAFLVRVSATAGGLALGLLLLVALGQRQSRLLMVTWFAVGLMAYVLVGGALIRRRVALGALATLAFVEAWLAGANLEHRNPMLSLAYGQQRESHVELTKRLAERPDARVLSIATAEYVIKETPALLEANAGRRQQVLDNTLVVIKWGETLTPNIPLARRVHSPDGYDGGLLPLRDYVGLTSAMLGPERARQDGVLISRLDHLPERRWLDLLGVRYVLAGRAKDASHDGLAFDRAVTLTLRSGERATLANLPLGSFNRVGLLSSLSENVVPGTRVGRLELASRGVPGDTVPIIAGAHTAGRRERSNPGGAQPLAEWGALPNDAVDWAARLDFVRQPVDRLTIVNSHATATLEVRALNMVDDARRESFSVVPDDRIDRAEFFDMKVYERADALPRAHIVHDVIVATEVFARITDPGFDPRRQVVLETTATVAQPPSPSSARIERDEPERVTVRTHADTAGVLVLADTHYPGWRATLNGVDVPVLRANGLFRGIVVPAGDHVVEFTFEPASVRYGALLSIITLVAYLTGLVWWIRRPR